MWNLPEGRFSEWTRRGDFHHKMGIWGQFVDICLAGVCGASGADWLIGAFVWGVSMFKAMRTLNRYAWGCLGRFAPVMESEK